ncbi:hypothetical protein ACLBXM_11795 [Xanthobacteraceae bacterium A53D]
MLVKGAIIAALVAGSVALKLPGGAAPRVSSSDPLRSTLIVTALFLKKHDITVRNATQDLDLIVMQGEGPRACKMRVAVMAPQGWHSGVVRDLAKPEDDMFFVYKGGIYEDQPIWRTRMDLYSTLVLRRFGADPALHPVLGVIADPSCKARALPWGDVGTLPDEADIPKPVGS